MQFTAWPEMLAWPYLILNGFLPYRDIAIAHNPLLIFILTIYYKIFGVGINQLQIFTILLICVNELLIYWVIKKLYTKKIAIFSLIIYTILLFIYDGYGLWFDLSLVPFAILLFYFVKKERWLSAGIIFTLGFLTKQTFVYFLIPILINKVDIKKFAIGTLVTLVIPVILFAYLGILDDYYNWAVVFGIFYLPHANGQVLLPTLKQLIISLIPFSPLPFIFYLLPWAIAGVMGVYPRFELFHFQPALPFLASAIALAFENKKTKIYSVVIIMFLMILFGRNLIRQKNLETRFYENDVKKVVSVLSNRYPLITNIYVINYWDNIYALTNTIPPKPLIPYIPWYLSYAKNYQLIINNLQRNIPEAVVVNDRQHLNFEKLQIFIERYYRCNVVEKQVEVCFKN